MYLPKHFAATEEQAVELIHQYPFATLIAGTEITHLPLLLKDGKLLGHLARRNPFWGSATEVTAVFQGPHGYISPRWYETHDVPTWNYAVVHARGRLRAIEDARGLIQILRAMSEKFDPEWRFGMPDDLRDPKALTDAIVGIEIELTGLEAKFKLSQNRAPGDRAGAVRGLQARGSENDLALGALMIRTRP